MEFASEIIAVFTKSTKDIWLYTFHELRNPSFTNFYYCVFLAYGVCFFLEVVLPAQRKHGVLSRRFFWQDTGYILFNDILVNLLGFFGLCAATEFILLKLAGGMGLSSFRIADITNWPIPVQILIMFLLQDFCEYVAHYFLHKSDILWQFHKIHHAQEELGAASTRHFHFIEMCIFKPIIYIPFALIGYSAADYFYFQITVQNVWGFFTHCNIKVKWGFLNYIINTPETHAWHHAKNIPFEKGANFASILNIWDVLFGFYYVPKNAVPQLGIPDNQQVPKTFLGQLTYPFKQIFSKTFRNQKQSSTIIK